MSFDAPFGQPETGAIALLFLSLTLALLVFWHRGRRNNRSLLPSALRLLTAGLLTFLLHNPVQSTPPKRTTQKSPLTVLIDASRSMQVRDQKDVDNKSLSRWNYVRRLWDNPVLLSSLSKQTDLQLFTFDSQVRPVTTDVLRRLDEPVGNRTDLSEAIRSVLRSPQRQSKGVQGENSDSVLLLISDGRDNGGGDPVEAAQEARAQGMTVYTLAVGQAGAFRDLRVRAMRSQIASLPGQRATIGAEIENVGYESRTIEVELLREGKRLQNRRLNLRSGRTQVDFTVREPAKGTYRYTVASTLLPDEANTTNNRATVLLTVNDARTRLLLLEGRPIWDTRFLVRTLRGDRSFSLDTLYRLTETGLFALSGSPTQRTIVLPHTLEEWGRYDALLLGRGCDTFFDAASVKTLQEWVSSGGKIVFLRGRAEENGSLLADLEPLTLSPEEVPGTGLRLTESGQSVPGLLALAELGVTGTRTKLPLTRYRSAVAKPLTTTLAESPERTPVIATQRYGSGKSLMFAGTGWWRGAMSPEVSPVQSEETFGAFWLGTLRWLINDTEFLPGQSFSLRADRTQVAVGETVRFSLLHRGKILAEKPTLSITLPNREKLPLNVLTQGQDEFTASFVPSQAGEYAVSVASPQSTSGIPPATCTFEVYPPVGEETNTSANPDLLARIAETGGGRTLSIEELSRLPELLQQTRASLTHQEKSRTLWDRGWVFAILLALITGEWVLRRRVSIQ